MANDLLKIIDIIKKAAGFEYDAVNKKIIKTILPEDNIFMDINQLCNNTDIDKKKKPATYSSNINNVESLYIELMQEKLMDLMKYVKLNSCASTININKSALIADGYKITFN